MTNCQEERALTYQGSGFNKFTSHELLLEKEAAFGYTDPWVQEIPGKELRSSPVNTLLLTSF